MRTLQAAGTTAAGSSYHRVLIEHPNLRPCWERHRSWRCARLPGRFLARCTADAGRSCLLDHPVPRNPPPAAAIFRTSPQQNPRLLETHDPLPAPNGFWAAALCISNCRVRLRACEGPKCCKGLPQGASGIVRAMSRMYPGCKGCSQMLSECRQCVRAALSNLSSSSGQVV